MWLAPFLKLLKPFIWHRCCGASISVHSWCFSSYSESNFENYRPPLLVVDGVHSLSSLRIPKKHLSWQRGVGRGVSTPSIGATYPMMHHWFWMWTYAVRVRLWQTDDSGIGDFQAERKERSHILIDSFNVCTGCMVESLWSLNKMLRLIPFLCAGYLFIWTLVYHTDLW